MQVSLTSHGRFCKVQVTDLRLNLVIVYWTEQRYQAMVPVLVSQIGGLSRLKSDNVKEAQHLAECFGAFAGSTTSESVLKSFNMAILMTTRSDNANERLIALIVLEKAWQNQEELVQFAPETVAEFLSECLQDENGAVEGAARKVLKRIEGLVGDLSAYLE
jgi:U3 small nucleolar RNA-associated protein 10